MILKNKSNDYILGLIMIFIGLIFGFLTTRLENTASQLFDSRFLPYLTAISMIILGLIQVIKHRDDKAEEKEKKDIKTLLISLGLLIFYVVGYSKLGFIISSIIFIFLTTINLTPKNIKAKPILYLLIAVITPILVYLLFLKGFHINLPSGILKY